MLYYSKPSLFVAIFAAAAIFTTARPHEPWRKWSCKAYRCAVSLCTDNTQAPSQDQLQIATNQYMYDSLGNDCGSITSVPLTKAVQTDADVPPNPEVYCPSAQGLWLSTFWFEIWRSGDNMTPGDHVKNWNGTRFPSSTMFKATCDMDNGWVWCEKGDDTCKDRYAPRPGDPVTP